MNTIEISNELIQFIEVTIACCRKYISVNEDEKIVIERRFILKFLASEANTCFLIYFSQKMQW